MKITWCATTDKGSKRESNEDSVLFNGEVVSFQDHYQSPVQESDISEAVNCFSVADGMGGHEAGEIASRMALEYLRDETAKNGLSFISTPDTLKTALFDLNMRVNRYAASIGKRGMGTTLTGMMFNDSKAILFNVGDSRVYRYRNGYLEQKTVDHSLFQHTGGRGPKNLITSCVGGGSDTMTADIYDVTGKEKKDDIFILCSDGLTDIDMDAYYGDIETMVKTNANDLGKMNSEMLRFSLDKGSSDNISIISVRFSE